jgi:hypothetical protein
MRSRRLRIPRSPPGVSRICSTMVVDYSGFRQFPSLPPIPSETEPYPGLEPTPARLRSQR